MILANLVVGDNVVPEFLQADCTPENLSRALRDVLEKSPLRRRQVEAFAKIDAIMSTGNATPSTRAADIVLATMREGAGGGVGALAEGVFRRSGCTPMRTAEYAFGEATQRC